MQSNFCRMGNQTSRFKPLTAHQAGGERHPLSTLIHSVTRGSEHHQSPHLLWAHLLSSTFYKATHCVTKLWAGTATRGSQLCSLPPFSALPAFAEIPSLGFASWMVAANASGGWKPDFPVYERGGCAGGCIFQERGVQYSFSFTRLNNSKNVPLCGSYPLAL